jgi:hypothetical protein
MGLRVSLAVTQQFPGAPLMRMALKDKLGNTVDLSLLPLHLRHPAALVDPAVCPTPSPEKCAAYRPAREIWMDLSLAWLP